MVYIGILLSHKKEWPILVYVLFREMSIQVFCPLIECVVCFDVIKCLKLFVNFGD